MKTVKTMVIVLMLAVMLGSCVIEVPVTRRPGHHYGWYKNPHNPHYRN